MPKREKNGRRRAKKEKLQERKTFLKKVFTKDAEGCMMYESAGNGRRAEH